MIFRRVGGSETEGLGDFRPGGRGAVGFQVSRMKSRISCCLGVSLSMGYPQPMSVFLSS